jgi:3-methyladenine DNA glycosylase AlkD
LSAYKILGNYLLDKKRDLLYKLARSKNLWERRISIISSLAFIKENQFKEALKISKMLLKDKEDLIHKASGWVLREIGKKNQKTLKDFLNKYTLKMPRVMLRYSIEKLPLKERKFYLNKKS